MNRTRLLSAICLSTLALPAAAHTGHQDSFSFLSGLAHPVGGFDHLLAMVAVGLWAAKQQGKQRWLAPVTFVLSMLIGALLGAAELALPAVESTIALSVLILGLMVASHRTVAPQIALPLIALFALSHGHAHGAEAPSGTLWLYMVGFVIATSALHTAGWFAGETLLRKAGALLRTAGIAIAASGLWLFGSAL